MRYEPPGLKQRISRVLQTTYDINPKEMKFIPVGEESISYKVTSDKATYLSKYSADNSTLDQTEKAHNLLLELQDNSFIVPPIKTKEPKTIQLLDTGYITVFPFIDGPLVVEENPQFHKELLEKLVEICVLLHNKTSEIQTELVKEDFATNYEQEFIEVLQKAKKNPEKKYATIVKHYEIKIQQLIEENSKHNEYYKQYPPKNIISHGDITGLNIIQLTGDIKLVDWDGAMLAPKERDLIFLIDNPNFNKKEYLLKINDTHIDERLIDYFKLRWSLDSIVLGLHALATKHVNEIDELVKLNEVKEYLG